MHQSTLTGRSVDVLLRPAPHAMVWSGVGQPHDQLAVPGVSLAPGDVLVEIELATVCGSDLHTVRGDRGAATPLVLGHEQIGRVVALGENARTAVGVPLALGDRIVWTVTVSCGLCDRCRAGLTQKCRTLAKYGHDRVHRGWELSGGFATHVHVLAGSPIVIVDDAIPAEVAAPASCATATVAAALAAASAVVPLKGATILVSGAGLLGLTACAMATDAGASVIVTDPDPARRRRALAFGAAAVADPLAASASPTGLAAVSGGMIAAGADEVSIALELSGAPAAVRTTIDTVGVGGVVILVGSVSPGASVPLDPESIVRRLITIRGVHNYTATDLERAVTYLAGAWRRHPFAELVGERFALHDLDAALERAAKGHDVRVGIDPRLADSNGNPAE
ncbi:alcohol dehydrogenase catalytic domain-containing protein [Leifsonia kafniensis]|uniref:alcohol dehydrogenase n=1 Tax=Leifsonia kafniensis TaxID=475957 RepID=A0ABP7KR08_9MICO